MFVDQWRCTFQAPWPGAGGVEPAWLPDPSSRSGQAPARMRRLRQRAAEGHAAHLLSLLADPVWVVDQVGNLLGAVPHVGALQARTAPDGGHLRPITCHPPLACACPRPLSRPPFAAPAACFSFWITLAAGVPAAHSCNAAEAPRDRGGRGPGSLRGSRPHVVSAIFVLVLESLQAVEHRHAAGRVADHLLRAGRRAGAGEGRGREVARTLAQGGQARRDPLASSARRQVLPPLEANLCRGGSPLAPA